MADINYREAERFFQDQRDYQLREYLKQEEANKHYKQDEHEDYSD